MIYTLDQKIEMETSKLESLFNQKLDLDSQINAVKHAINVHNEKIRSLMKSTDTIKAVKLIDDEQEALESLNNKEKILQEDLRVLSSAIIRHKDALTTLKQEKIK